MRRPTLTFVITSVAVATTVALVLFFITPLGVSAVSPYIALLGLLSMLFGGIGSLLSISDERIGGACIMTFPLVALMTGAASGDLLLFACSLLWWTAPIMLGGILALGKRSILSPQRLAGLGFASLALPWYTVYSSSRVVGSSAPAVVTVSHLFLPEIIVQGTTVSSFSSDSILAYLGFIPLALVTAGTTFYFFKSRKKIPDAQTSSQRLVRSGVLLLISTFLTGIAFVFYTFTILIFSGIDHDFVDFELGFASAGFWSALTTGVVMMVPVNRHSQKSTGTVSSSLTSQNGP